MSDLPSSSSDAPPLPPERVEEFVSLLGQNQRRVFLYVACLVPHWSDAEEVVQETNLVLWREFAKFQPGTNFAAWACKVAFHQVLAWRKRRQRNRLAFTSEFLEVVAEEVSRDAERLEERSEALARCVEQLPADQRRLLRRRYSEGGAVDAVAKEAGRTVEAVYRALSRIRHTLHDCVTRRLTAAGG